MKVFFRLLFLSLLIAGCSSYEGNMKKASSLIDSNKDQKALNLLVKALSMARTNDQKKKALTKVVDVCERKLKDYQCALNAYSELFPFAANDKERESYHFNMGSIYFFQLQDYEKALAEFSETVSICSDPVTCLEAKIKISHCYFYKKEYRQAINEIEDLNLQQKKENKILDSTKYIQAAILHAQALMGLEKYEKAPAPLLDAQQMFPEESNKLKVPIILSVAYRENKMLNESIEVLKRFKNETKDVSSQVYAETQISKMEKRLELQPGGPTGNRMRR